jgi:UDP-N-acetylmuramate--alanine ligase
MGIGGTGISAVVQMLLNSDGENVTITGCDMQESSITQALQRVGVPVEIGHSAEHVESIDRLIVVPAALVLNPHHPELAVARERGIPIATWQEVLGELMQGKCVLSVSGVHGKGTATAMLALMLVDAGYDPTCEIGAIIPRFGVNYRLGKSAYFVNEADEYYNNFWHYHPRLAIVTSLEFEHPEFFANYAEYLDSFEHFVRGMDIESDWPLPTTLILNAGNAGCLELLKRLGDWPGNIVTYGVQMDGDEGGMSAAAPSFEAFDIQVEGETSFRVRTSWPGGFAEERRISLQLPGEHNIQNALAALTAARIAGVEAESIVKTLEDFRGIQRRFEIRNREPVRVNGQMMDVILVDDYAHHPTAIAATLLAAKRLYPDRRIVAVYQPHMFSRTKTFFAQFLTAFDSADVVLIADIYPARERDTGLISSFELVRAMEQQPRFARGEARVMHSGSVQASVELLRTLLRPGDLVLIMGAGDIYKLSETLLEQT